MLQAGGPRGLRIYPQPHQLGLEECGSAWPPHPRPPGPQGIFWFPFPMVKEERVICLWLQDSRDIGGTRME